MKKGKKLKKEAEIVEKEIVKEVKVIEHEVILAEKLLKKFEKLEVAHVFLGAILLITPFALLTQVWVRAITSSWGFILGLNAVVLLIAATIIYITGFRIAKKHHQKIVHGTAKRLFSLYLVCFAVTVLFLSIIRSGEWILAPDLALKQVFTFVLPALLGGLIADLVLS